MGAEKPLLRTDRTTSRTMMAEIGRLAIRVEALAALGAQLRLRQDRLDPDPRVGVPLWDSVRAIVPQYPEHQDCTGDATVLAFVQSVFRQAFDLLEHPARAPGWNYEDPAILQAQGQLSRLVVRGIDALACQRPQLAASLQRPGLFLDVGTGVGWIAIDAARSWPAMRVLGIDPWEPALGLARENVARAQLTDRIDLRLQRVEQLDAARTVTLAWVPGPFFAREILERVLIRVHRALAPGGWLIFGLNPRGADPLEEALLRLRTARWGGHPWTPEEIEERLRAFNFEEIEVFSPALPIQFVIGQKTATSTSLSSRET